MMFMVSVDAFSQALTNPLLSKNVFGEQSFSQIGLEAINKTSSLDDIVRRNSAMGYRKATFSATTPPPGSYGFPFLGRLFGTVDFLFVSGWEQFFRARQTKYRSTVFKVKLVSPSLPLRDLVRLSGGHHSTPPRW